MQKPKDFESAKAYGDYEPLPAGGYVCKIVGIEETKSKAGNSMIKIAVDIAEGEEAGRFEQAYKANTQSDKKWPCVIYQVVENRDGSTNGYFKAFTDTAVESNKSFEIQWGEAFAECFKGKLIGVLFGREQYENREGKVVWGTKPQQGYKTVEDIRSGNFKVPEDKPMEGMPKSVPDGFGAIEDEDIPF